MEFKEGKGETKMRPPSVDVFHFSEGGVVKSALQNDVTKSDFEDLEFFFALILRKAKSRIAEKEIETRTEVHNIPTLNSE